MRTIGISRKALIAGGAVFTGSHLAESRLADGSEVYVLGLAERVVAAVGSESAIDTIISNVIADRRIGAAQAA